VLWSDAQMGPRSKGKSAGGRGNEKPERQTNPALLRQAMLRRLPRRIAASGQLRLPAVPALLDHYLATLATVFAGVGRPFSADEMAGVRAVLEPQLQEGFAASPFAHLVIRYETDPPPEATLSYRVALEISTMNDEYAGWVQTRTPPLFGAHPDAKVLGLARGLGEPSRVPILDVGAGTGRNTLPLAREGFATDAVELAPALATVLREEVARAGLPVRVFEGDVFDPALGIPPAHYRLIVMAEVVASHARGQDKLRAWFERIAELLAPGGLVVLSAFLSAEGYRPDPLARQLSEVFWSCLFTRRELAEASAGLSLDRISDESVFEYERQHLAPEAWPPTGWFAEWANGQDLFDLPAGSAPFELRWLVYRKR
jgi:SAM-dependent methyltransferase